MSQEGALQGDSIRELRTRLDTLIRQFHKSGFVPVMPDPGLSQGEAMVLHAIEFATQRGGEARPSDIAQHMRVTPSAVSQVVKHLEAMGYVTRERSKEDSRVVCLALTDQAQEILGQSHKDADAFAQQLFAYVGEDNLLHLVDTVQRITEFFESSPVMSTLSSDEEAPFSPPPSMPLPFAPNDQCCAKGPKPDSKEGDDAPCA